MKIGFKPQSLVQNLVLEKFSNNGNSLKRIIEMPGKNAKTLEINYEKTKFIPTQWYVSNYNVIKRDNKSTFVKSLQSTKSFPNENHTVVQRYNENHTVVQRYNKIGKPEQLTIDVANGEVNTTTKSINNISRTGV